jgi:hypothetical protein
VGVAVPHLGGEHRVVAEPVVERLGVGPVAGGVNQARVCQLTVCRLMHADSAPVNRASISARFHAG